MLKGVSLVLTSDATSSDLHHACSLTDDDTGTVNGTHFRKYCNNGCKGFIDIISVRRFCLTDTHPLSFPRFSCLKVVKSDLWLYEPALWGLNDTIQLMLLPALLKA